MSVSSRGLPSAAQQPPQTPCPRFQSGPRCHSQSCWLLEAFPSLPQVLELVPQQLEKQRAWLRIHAMPPLRGCSPTNTLSPRAPCPQYLIDQGLLLKSFYRLRPLLPLPSQRGTSRGAMRRKGYLLRHFQACSCLPLCHLKVLLREKRGGGGEAVRAPGHSPSALPSGCARALPLPSRPLSSPALQADRGTPRPDSGHGPEQLALGDPT